MFVAQQHLIGKTAAVRVDQRYLATPLAGEIVAGRFSRERVIELNAVGVIGFHTVDQNHVVHVHVQRETRANHQNVIT